MDTCRALGIVTGLAAPIVFLPQIFEIFGLIVISLISCILLRSPKIAKAPFMYVVDLRAFRTRLDRLQLYMAGAILAFCFLQWVYFALALSQYKFGFEDEHIQVAMFIFLFLCCLLVWFISRKEGSTLRKSWDGLKETFQLIRSDFSFAGILPDAPIPAAIKRGALCVMCIGVLIGASLFFQLYSFLQIVGILAGIILFFFFIMRSTMLVYTLLTGLGITFIKRTLRIKSPAALLQSESIRIPSKLGDVEIVKVTFEIISDESLLAAERFRLLRELLRLTKSSFLRSIIYMELAKNYKNRRQEKQP